MVVKRAVCVLCLAVVWTSAQAFAEESTSAEAASFRVPPRPRAPTKEELKEAKRLFAEGTRAFGHKEYRLAAEQFLASYALSGKAELLYNAGVAWENLKEPRTARECLRRFVSEAALDNPKLKEGRERLKKLEERLGPEMSPAPLPPPPPPPVATPEPAANPTPAAPSTANAPPTVAQDRPVATPEAASMAPAEHPEGLKVERAHEGEGKGYRRSAYVAWGIGVVAAAVGVYFAYDASVAQGKLTTLLNNQSYPASQSTNVESLVGRERLSGGLGVGLLITAGIAVAAGGALWVVAPSHATPEAGAQGRGITISF